MPVWLAKLVCHWKGHAWGQDWAVIHDADGVFRERRLVVRCWRCPERIPFEPRRFDTKLR